MSSEEDKIKNSRRRQNDENNIRKQTKIAKSYGFDVKEPHKFAKHHAMNCGNPKCIMCSNPRTIFKKSTVQEESFKQTESWGE